MARTEAHGRRCGGRRRRAVLVHRTNAHPPVSLSPLLRFRAGEGETDMDVDFDELFFLNAGSLQRLGASVTEKPIISMGNP